MELDENPVMSPSGRLKPIGPTILVVAASNASRTADALESAGECVSRAVIIPGWRCIKPKIPAMVDLVRSKLDEFKGDTVVILQLFTTASSWHRLKMEGCCQQFGSPWGVNSMSMVTWCLPPRSCSTPCSTW